MKSIQNLLENRDISNELIAELVEDALNEATQEGNQELQQLLSQKEKLELQIRHKTQELQHIRQHVFGEIEHALRENYKELDESYICRLTELKFDSIDILEFLAEMTESAFINAIESGIDLEHSFKEITRDITYKTLRDGHISLDRAKHVVATIIAVAGDMAQAVPTQAEVMLRGTLYGAKKGLIQSINEFKERFAFIPDEANPIHLQNLQQSFDELQHAEKFFLQTIHEQAEACEPMIRDKMIAIAEKMRPDLSDLITVSRETLVIISNRLAKFGQTAMKKGEKVLQSKAAIEAKRMGVHVWDKAKGALENSVFNSKDKSKKN